MANITTTNTSKEVTEYIPFGGADVEFGEGAVVPAPENPLLQYATGLPAMRPKFDAQGNPAYDEETGEVLVDNLYYAGFFTALGKDKELDAAMEKHNVPWIDIVHGSGEVARHWMIEKPTLFLMAMGIPSNANSGGQYGMVYMWRQKRNSTKSETILNAQVIIRQLLPDYTKPFVFTMKSTQTADALMAMRRQYKVLAKAREFVGSMALPLWAYSAPFGPSKKQEVRGGDGASKMIYPMLSGIPDEISPLYLQRHEVGVEYIDHFKECTERAVEWATSLTQRIASGAEPHEPWQNGNGSNDEVVKAPF